MCYLEQIQLFVRQLEGVEVGTQEGEREGYTRVEEGLIEENPGSVLQYPILHPFKFLDEFSTIFRVLALFIGEYTARVSVLSVS